jgi:hypothetical protein
MKITKNALLKLIKEVLANDKATLRGRSDAVDRDGALRGLLGGLKEKLDRNTLKQMIREAVKEQIYRDIGEVEGLVNVVDPEMEEERLAPPWEDPDMHGLPSREEQEMQRQQCLEAGGTWSGDGSGGEDPLGPMEGCLAGGGSIGMGAEDPEDILEGTINEAIDKIMPLLKQKTRKTRKVRVKRKSRRNRRNKK